MNELDTLMGVETTQLSELVELDNNKPLPIPSNALRNQAALVSMLSEENAGNTYQSILSEAESGKTYTIDRTLSKARQEEKVKDTRTAISVLADPTIPFEQKKIVIAGINSGYSAETSTMVATRNFEQPSEGENREQENVRISASEQFAAIRKRNEEIQVIKNKHIGSMNPDAIPLLVDLVSFVQPFAANKYSATTLHKALQALNVDMSKGKATALPGEAMVAIREALQNLPPEQEVEAARKISNIIKENSSLFLNSDNNYAEIIQLEQILEKGGYNTFDRVLDNVSGVLDAIGFGFVRKIVGTGASKITSKFTRTPSVEVSKTLQRSITDTTSNVSPLKILQDANPEKARKTMSVIVQSGSDEFAKAMTGTSKDAAVVGNVSPQPLAKDGSVEAKLVDPLRYTKEIEIDQEIAREAKDVGAIFLTDNERKATSAQIYNDITNIDGLTIHDNMASVGIVGNRSVIKAVYGNTEGGFLNAEEALSQAEFALKEYGVGQENITLLKRVDNEYVPISLAEAKGVEGSYLVQLDADINLDALDVLKYDPQSVKRNWFDRIPSLRSNKAGTVANHLLDHASMLSPVYTGAGVVASDKATRISKMMINKFSDFSDSYIRLPKERQAKLYEYIKEANLKGLDDNVNDLLGKGFVKEEIESLQAWRKAWDTVWYFENQDVIKTSSHKGYKLLENADGDRFVARPVYKGTKIDNAYDPSTNQVVSLLQKEVDELYEKGGTFAELRRPEVINGVQTTHIISRNTPTEYLRAFRVTDQILDYRPGYYQVHYKAPKFIEQIIRNAAGKETGTRTIAVAGSTQEAEQAISRINTTEGLSDVNPNWRADFRIRDDIKKLKIDTDAYWDLMSSSGRIAQRHRGKRLMDSSAPLTMFDSKYVADPVESAIRASRSIASRVAFRDVLEFSKARAMQQYSDFFPEGRWVENSNSLVSRTSAVGADIADARTTVEYINFLEKGYDNALDEGFKSTMNAFANMASGRGWNKTEKAFLHLGSIDPTDLAKNGVFQAYLAFNPLRQLIIQPHQAIRLAAYDPIYVLRGGLLEDTGKYLLGQTNPSYLAKSADAKAITDFVENSGMLDAVDMHNLVRGSLQDLATSSNNLVRKGAAIAEIPRKVGFDKGEQLNLLSHLIAVRHKFISKGLDVTNPTVRDEAYSLVRALTLDMNRAGDSPYNQNSLGLFMQFFQVFHKTATSVTVNRRIPGDVKLRLAAADLALFGVPGATILHNIFGKDVLPEDPALRESVVFGAETVLLNKALSNIAGKDINVDFTKLSPYNMDGFAGLLHAVVSGGFVEFLQNSPAFSLYVKEGSKMREAFGRMFRYFGWLDTHQGLEPEDAISVLSGVAEISAGWSNYMKAKVIYETGKIKTRTGNPLSTEERFIYSAAKLFGFSSLEESMFYAVSKELREGTKEYKDSVQQFYKDYVRVLTRDQKFTSEDPDYAIKVLGAAKLVFKDDPVAMSEINKLLARDIEWKQDSLTRQILNAANIRGLDEHVSTLKTLPALKNDDLNRSLRIFNDVQTEINKEQ